MDPAPSQGDAAQAGNAAGSPYDGPIMTAWLLLLLGVVLTVGTALFVAAEFSLVALDRPTVQKAVDAGEPGARSVLTSHRRLSTQLSACQLGITLTTLVLGFIASPSIGALLLGPLQSLGLSESTASSVASVLAMLIATVFSMIVGEMVPKTLAVSLPLATAKVAAGPVRWFGIAMKPMILLLNGVANRTLLALGIQPQEELSAARSPAELASLVRSSAEAGTLDRSTARLVTASLGFADQTAADVMTPRSRATSIERTATAADLVALARRTGHSRFPVVGADWDDIDGIVHVKKAIAVPFDRRTRRAGVGADGCRRCSCPRRCGSTRCCSSCARAACSSPSSSTSTAAPRAWSPSRTSSRRSSARSTTSTTARRPPGASCATGRGRCPGLWRPDEVRARVGVGHPRRAGLRDGRRLGDGDPRPGAGRRATRAGRRLDRSGRRHGRAPRRPGAPRARRARGRRRTTPATTGDAADAAEADRRATTEEPS